MMKTIIRTTFCLFFSSSIYGIDKTESGENAGASQARVIVAEEPELILLANGMYIPDTEAVSIQHFLSLGLYLFVQTYASDMINWLSSR